MGERRPSARKQSGGGARRASQNQLGEISRMSLRLVPSQRPRCSSPEVNKPVHRALSRFLIPLCPPDPPSLRYLPHFTRRGSEGRFPKR